MTRRDGQVLIRALRLIRHLTVDMWPLEVEWVPKAIAEHLIERGDAERIKG